MQSVTGNSASIPAGSLATESLSYASAAAAPGQLLEIRLISAGDQSDFDNVTLTMVTAPGTMIQNPSFETANAMTIGCGAGCSYNFDVGIPGWTITGDGGSFQPSSAYLTLPAQDGQTVAYSQGGTIGQVLASALLANSTYTLSVDVGHRLDGYETDYTIELLAGGNVLSSVTGNSSSIPMGSLATQSVSYSSGAAVTAGQLLEIRLISAGEQSDFDNVVLTINSPPAITSATNATFTLGVAGSFSATATGSPAPTWSESGTLPNGLMLNTATGILSGIPAVGGTYPITITADNGVAPDASQSFTLTINSPPTIAAQPLNQTVIAGQPATFMVAAIGTAPLTYRWQLDGVDVGTNSSIFTAPATMPTDSGEQVSVIVSNSAGTALSNAATLTVVQATAPGTYYVDFSSGSDTNTGTSTDSPWQHAPGMNLCAFQCASIGLQGGDRIVFKGGVTWDATAFPMIVSASGASGNPIYFGVDRTWFAGDAWSRPVFDLENSTWYVAPVLVNSADFVTFDNLEIANEAADNSGSWPPRSSISVNGGSNITIQNCYIHGWSIQDPIAGSDFNPTGGIAFYNGSVGGVVQNCVLDGSPESDSGIGIYGGASVQGNIVENVPNGIVMADPAADVSGNQVFNVAYSVDPSVSSGAIFAYASANIYNNIVHDLVAGALAIGLESGAGTLGNTQYVYNNLIWNVGDNSPITIASDKVGALATSNQFIYNNTLSSGAAAGCVTVNPSFFSPANLSVQNNQCISDQPSSQAWCWNNAGGSFECGPVANLSFGNNVLMTAETAASQGFTLANSFQPSSPSGATVAAGLNLISDCVTVGSSLCSDRLGAARPGDSTAWDVGAYQYQTVAGSIAPIITMQPVRQAVTAGQTATFTVIAAGTAPLNYQWQKNGTAIPGATSSTYMSSATTASDDGTSISVVVSNSAGSAISSPAVLSVNLAPGQLTVNPAALNFGTGSIGTPSTFSVTLTNTSSDYVTISSVSVSDPNFVATGMPPTLIMAPGEVATLNIVFTPEAKGIVQGTVIVGSDAAGSPTVIPLSGTGIAPPHLVSFSWDPSTSSVFGYYVYRAANPSGPYARLNSAPVTATQYTDSAVQSGQTYLYWVTSVDSNTLESVFSNSVAATIPTP